jgi:hypothetical protein
MPIKMKDLPFNFMNISHTLQFIFLNIQNILQCLLIFIDKTQDNSFVVLNNLKHLFYD